MDFRICNYAHPISSDIDPDKHLSAPKLDRIVNKCVARATEALKRNASGYEDWARGHIASIFKGLQATHKSIRILLSPEEPKPTSVDALPLARVQLESLYAVCLMLEDPKWVRVYVKDGWKKQYKKLLLKKEERENLPRCDEPLKEMQSLMDQFQYICGVTDAEKRTIEKEELGIPLPPGFVESKIERFPTPGKVIEKVADPARKRMLIRLRAEYEQLSSYVHGLPEATVQKELLGKHKTSMSSKQIEALFQKQVVGPSLGLGCLSVVQATSELTSLYPYDVELRAALVDAWNLLLEHNLLAIAIWEIRTKTLIGSI